MATVRSAISKGRNFQKRIKELFQLVFCLDDDACRTAIGCETGMDIKFSRVAQETVGLAIECKNQKNMNIWSAIEQAKRNCPAGVTEAVIFKRGELGAHKTYICVPLEHYLNLRRSLLLQEEE